MTFFTYDNDDVPADTIAVLEASAVLEITEFHLFELAYQHWFGEPAASDHLEAHYTRYMFNGFSPPWVRTYCRAVFQAVQAQSLDPVEFGVAPLEESVSRRRYGVRALVAVFAVLAALHVIALLVANH